MDIMKKEKKKISLFNADPRFSQAEGSESLLSHLYSFQVKSSHQRN